eukprot:Rhum_TRINITY_DN14426_c19_g1::Rhum_TRINITY_DN14426_c19_g1_i1::g.87254::m.87254
MLRRVASSARSGAVGASTSATRSPAGGILDAVRRAAAADSSDVPFDVLRRCRERLDTLEKACVVAVPDLTLQDRTFVLGAFYRARAGNGQLLGAVLDVVRREVVPHRNTSTRPLLPLERECVTSIVVHAARLDAHQNSKRRSATVPDERVGAVPQMIALLLQPTPPGTDDANRLLEAVLRWLVLVDCEAAPEKGRALQAEAYQLLRELLAVQCAHFTRALSATEPTARNPEEGGHDDASLPITRLCTFLDAYVALCCRDGAQSGSLAAETVVDTACRITTVWLDGVCAGVGGVKTRAALRLVAAVFSKLSAVHDAALCGGALRSNLLGATAAAHAVAAWWRQHAAPHAASVLVSQGAPTQALQTADAVASFASAAALLLQRCCAGCDGAAPTGDALAAASAAATAGDGDESARPSVPFADVVAQAAEVLVDALGCGGVEGPPSPHDAGAAVHNARVECVLIECVVAAAASCAAAEGRRGAAAAAAATSLRAVSTQLLRQVERRLAGWYLPARAEGDVEGCLAFAVEPSAEGGPVGLLSVYLRTLAQGAEALRRDAALRASHVALSAHVLFMQAKEAAVVAASSANDACGFLAFAVPDAVPAGAQRRGGKGLHPGLAAVEAAALLAALLGPPLRHAVAAHAAAFASPLRCEDQRLRDAFAVAVAFGAALPLPLPHGAGSGAAHAADKARLSFFGQSEHADAPRAAARRRDPWRAIAEGGVWMEAAEAADTFARGSMVRRQVAQRRFNVGHRVLRAAQALAAAEVAGAQPAELAAVVPVLGVVALGCEAAEEAVGSADARRATGGSEFATLERSVAWLIESGSSASAECAPARRQNLLVDYGYACTTLDALVEQCARLVQADRRVSLPLSQGVQLGAELVGLRRTLTKRNTRAIDAVVYTSLADAAAQLQVMSCRPHAFVPVSVRQALWLASVCMSVFARDSKMGHTAVTVFCRARSIVEASCNVEDGGVAALTSEAAAVVLWCLASHADDFGAPVRLMSELVAQCARDVSQVSHEALLHATLALHSWGLPASQLQGELSRRIASKELQAQRLGARCMLKETGPPFPWL